MDIPWTEFAPATLRAMVEEFVTRDGTDYGAQEITHEKKVEQVLEMLKKGEVKVVYDNTSETCDLRVISR